MVQIGKYINSSDEDLGSLFFDKKEVDDQQIQYEGGDNNQEPMQIPPKGQALDRLELPVGSPKVENEPGNKQFFVGTIPIEKTAPKRLVLDYTGKVHIYVIHSIEEKVQELYEYAKKNEIKEFKTLFSIFVLKAADKNKQISFNYIYELSKLEAVQRRIDADKPPNEPATVLVSKELREMVMKYNKKVLLMHIADVMNSYIKLDYENVLGPRANSVEVKEISKRLNQQPFEIKQHGLSEAMVQEVLQFFYEDRVRS